MTTPMTNDEELSWVMMLVKVLAWVARCLGWVIQLLGSWALRGGAWVGALGGQNVAVSRIRGSGYAVTVCVYAADTSTVLAPVALRGVDAVLECLIQDEPVLEVYCGLEPGPGGVLLEPGQYPEESPGQQSDRGTNGPVWHLSEVAA